MQPYYDLTFLSIDVYISSWHHNGLYTKRVLFYKVISFAGFQASSMVPHQLCVSFRVIEINLAKMLDWLDRINQV
jgi:hypothetical protein